MGGDKKAKFGLKSLIWLVVSEVAIIISSPHLHPKGRKGEKKRNWLSPIAVSVSLSLCLSVSLSLSLPFTFLHDDETSADTVVHHLLAHRRPSGIVPDKSNVNKNIVQRFSHLDQKAIVTGDYSFYNEKIHPSDSRLARNREQSSSRCHLCVCHNASTSRCSHVNTGRMGRIYRQQQ